MCRFSLNTRPSTWGCKVAKTQHPEKLWVSWNNPWTNRSNRGTSAQLFGRSPFDKSKHVRGFCITGGSLKRRLAQSMFRLVLEGRELHSWVWWCTGVTLCLEMHGDYLDEFSTIQFQSWHILTCGNRTNRNTAIQCNTDRLRCFRTAMTWKTSSPWLSCPSKYVQNCPCRVSMGPEFQGVHNLLPFCKIAAQHSWSLKPQTFPVWEVNLEAWASTLEGDNSVLHCSAICILFIHN